MSAKEIIDAVDGLPIEEKEDVYNHILKLIRKREHVLHTLEKIRGVGKGLWDKDAQEYINELRADDRF